VFTWLNKQGVRSDRGFEVQRTGRFEAEYREDGRVVLLSVESGCYGGMPSIVLKSRAFARWSNGIPIPEEKQAQMLQNFKEALEFQGLKTEVEEGMTQQEFKARIGEIEAHVACGAWDEIVEPQRLKGGDMVTENPYTPPAAKVGDSGSERKGAGTQKLASGRRLVFLYLWIFAWAVYRLYQDYQKSGEWETVNIVVTASVLGLFLLIFIGMFWYANRPERKDES